MVDIKDLKSFGSNPVAVRVRSQVPLLCALLLCVFLSTVSIANEEMIQFIEIGDSESVERIIIKDKTRSKINSGNKFNTTPLMVAVLKNDEKIAKLLLQNKAKQLHLFQRNWTALLWTM